MGTFLGMTVLVLGFFYVAGLVDELLARRAERSNHNHNRRERR